MSKPTDLPLGTEFGKLTTVSKIDLRARNDGRNRAWVRVRCACDVEKDVMVYNLKSGNTTSCGCTQREQVAIMFRKHGATAGGGSRPRLYRIWRGMRERCTNPNARNYKWYGAKGITICAEWNEFGQFREWAETNGYGPGLELDRKQTEYNYEPSNCQWITKKANIRRRDLMWNDDIEMRLHQVARETGVSPYEIIRLAVEAYLSG